MTSESNDGNSSLIVRLFESFQDLECAIAEARSGLEKKPSVPAHVFQRLDSYNEILSKQRILAGILAEHVRKGDALETARYVQIINGLSGMIISDARSILSSLRGNEITQAGVSDDAEDDKNLC